MKRILLILIGASFSLCVAFITINLGVNLFERKFKGVDYNTLIGYCQKHGLSESYAIVVDFNKPSGLHRFFVCDLKKHTIVASSLCAHGAGGGSTAKRPIFSNEVGSNCSSLGHFKIVGKHKMRTSGLPSFKLIGLDKSNSNAERRGILIHSAKLISMFRWGMYPFYLPMDKRISSGCFVVDIDMMGTIEGILEKEWNPILVYAFH